MRYATKQRTRLLDVLQSHSDAALSVEQIVSLCGDGEVSRSAIYRNLASLEREGLVKRSPLPASQTYGYRYVGSDECKNHLHLTCSVCGTTYHLPSPTSENLVERVLRDSDFQVTLSDSVLSGVCARCKKN